MQNIMNQGILNLPKILPVFVPIIKIIKNITLPLQSANGNDYEPQTKAEDPMIGV
jgi:hypothetical protein